VVIIRLDGPLPTARRGLTPKVKSEIAKWAKVVKDAGVKIDL